MKYSSHMDMDLISNALFTVSIYSGRFSSLARNSEVCWKCCSLVISLSAVNGREMWRLTIRYKSCRVITLKSMLLCNNSPYCERSVETYHQRRQMSAGFKSCSPYWNIPQCIWQTMLPFERLLSFRVIFLNFNAVFLRIWTKALCHEQHIRAGAFVIVLFGPFYQTQLLTMQTMYKARQTHKWDT